MPRVPVVLQTAETDCGPACLTAVLRGAGERASLAQLRNLTDPGRDGTSALTLRDTAALWGMQMHATMTSPEELSDRVEEIPLPAIVHLSRQHYVVADKILTRPGGSRTEVRVMDPAVGRRRMGREEIRAQASGLLLVPGRVETPAEPPPDPPHRSTLLKELLGAVRADLVRAVLLSVLLAVGGLGLPVLTAVIVDGMIAADSPPHRWLYAGLGLALAMGLVSLARYLILAGLQHRLAASLSTRVATTLFTRELRFFDRRSVGDLFGRIESAHAVHALLSVTLLGAALDAVLTVGFLTALAVIAPPLAAVTALTVFLTLGVTLVLARRCAALRREEILVTADSSTLLVDSITGVSTLRAYGAEERVLGTWAGLLDRRLRLTLTSARLGAVSLSLLTGVTIATPLVVLILASTTGMVTPGQALGLMAVASAALAPVTSLGTQLLQAADLRPLLDRLDDVETADAERRGQTDPGRLRGEFALEGLGFGYSRDSGEVLGPIDARIKAGAKIGVLGPTGCGKSTLAHLLCGLYTPTRGTVRIDGLDLRDLDLQRVREQIGVVFQDNWLGAGSIREAVLAAREGYSDEDVWRALVKAQVAEEVAALPLGLETRLGSGGQGLSGGQRQRLAIARALLSDPVILILDEATSALDARTEGLIDATLAQLRMTRVIITHRLGVVADADELWIIDDGGLVERGTPSELRASAEHYAALLSRSSALSVT